MYHLTYNTQLYCLPAAPAMSLASTEIDIQSIITGKQSALHQIGLDLSVMRPSTATLPTSRHVSQGLISLVSSINTPLWGRPTAMAKVVANGGSDPTKDATAAEKELQIGVCRVAARG